MYTRPTMMGRKALVTVLLFSLLPFSATAQGHQKDSTSQATQQYPSFLDKQTLPDGRRYLPAPPDFDSNLFVGDEAWHQWGQSQRNTERGEQARQDAKLDVDYFLGRFSASFGMPLTREGLPQTVSLLEKVINDAVKATSTTKRHHNRQRPFLHYGEGTLIPEEEETHHTPSYPSSHSAAGWAVALVLSELHPDSAEAILGTGLDYGISRIIAGYHYKSDVDAGQLVASACVARLHADKAFAEHYRQAVSEVGRVLNPAVPVVPEGPKTEFVLQLRVTLGEAFTIPDTQHGRRTVIPITGGTFEGPGIKGTIVNGGADYQIANAAGRTELEAIYCIKTDDGVYIHIRNRGIIAGGKDADGRPTFYFKCAPQFEAPADSPYAWLNNSLFLCAPAFGEQFNGIVLNVWRVL